MGDSDAAAQDKTKEKKKKKTGSTKEKEPRKKSGAESDLQAGVKPPDSELPNPEAAPTEAAPQQEPPITQGEAPPDGAKKSKKKSVSKESTGEEAAAPSEGGLEGHKTDVAEGVPEEEGAAIPATGTSRKASAVEGAPAEENEEEGEEAVKPQSDGQPSPFGGSYIPPPAATKRDIDLLQDMDENKLMELKEVFELFDYDQDGYIDYKDLKLTYQSLGYPDMPEDDITNMLAEAVSPLDFDAFVILLGYKTIEMDPETVLVEALACWDYDNSGLISEDRIKHDLVTWGDKFTPEEAELALEDAPVYMNKKGTAMIDYLKFSNTLCGLRKKTRNDQPEEED